MYIMSVTEKLSAIIAKQLLSTMHKVFLASMGSKKKIYGDLIKNQSLLPPILKELRLCEVLQEKMTEKKKRLESGQLDDSDIAMGSKNSPVAP